MVELVGIYRRHGLEISSRELPDFLPLFLEYLSLLSEEEAMTMLGDAAGVLGAIESRLSHRRSSYAAIFATLRALAGIEEAATVEGSAEQFDDLAALDKAWEEAAVTFGPEQIGGSSSACDRAATMVARMSTPQRRPAP